MPAYAVGIVSMMPLLKSKDDSKVYLRQWWDNIEQTGPLFGCFPTSRVKNGAENLSSKLEEALEYTSIKIMTTGRG